MASSKDVLISVKVPINWEVMTERKKQRLRQMVGRDTRVIHAFLGIIERHENELLTGRNKDRIADGKLDQLTMTALKVKSGYKQRPIVPHDLKVRFPRMSQNEMAECRKTAVSQYESYLKLRDGIQRASRPTRVSSSRRIPRWVFTQRFQLIEKKNSISSWWIDTRDSLDSSIEEKRVHDRLLIPLKVSPFHVSQLSRGDVKALQIFTDRSGKWWATLAVRVETDQPEDNGLPPAILGIDLGIEKAACASVLTPNGVKETRFFKQVDKIERIKNLDIQVSELQRKLELNRAEGIRYDMVIAKLKELRHKRENVAKEYDRVLVRQLLDYINELSGRYTLHVSIGRLKNIRYTARKGNYRGRRFRGLIHRWAFARITKSLVHGLAQLGWSITWKDSRFQVVPENWTSIMCWKCGRKGTRPKQNLFVCPTCGNKCNADMNGAINIAARLLTLTKSLHSVRGLGKWMDTLQRVKRPRPKARGKSASRRKSLLSSKSRVSGSRESAAVHHAQMSLLSFSDGAELGDNDPAVVRTVETLSAAESDTPAPKQETEVRPIGGNASL